MESNFAKNDKNFEKLISIIVSIFTSKSVRIE